MAEIKKNNNFFFPASNIRRYYYPSTTSTFSTLTFVSITNNINYTPIYISKYIINPNFCIELVSGTGTVQVGIYDGKDGFENAKLLWDGDIVTSVVGINKIGSNVRLKEGWYILGAINISLASLQTRAAATNYYRVLFGERTDISISGGVATSHHIQNSGTGRLVQNIGSGTSITLSTQASAPIIALEY